MTAYTYPVHRVHRVTDGDTLWVVIDVGFRATLTQRIRLSGVDAPEMREPGGPEARAAVLEWVAAHPVLRVSTHAEDQYGRWLGDLTDAGSGESLAVALIEAGVATPWRRA